MFELAIGPLSSMSASYSWELQMPQESEETEEGAPVNVDG